MERSACGRAGTGRRTGFRFLLRQVLNRIYRYNYSGLWLNPALETPGHMSGASGRMKLTATHSMFDGRLQIYKRSGRHWQCEAHIKDRLATSSIKVMQEQGARLAARGLAQASAVEHPDLHDDP